MGDAPFLLCEETFIRYFRWFHLFFSFSPLHIYNAPLCVMLLLLSDIWLCEQLKFNTSTREDDWNIEFIFQCFSVVVEMKNNTHFSQQSKYISLYYPAFGFENHHFPCACVSVSATMNVEIVSVSWMFFRLALYSTHSFTEKLYNKWHFLGFMKKRWMVMLPGTGRVFVMCVRAQDEMILLSLDFRECLSIFLEIFFSYFTSCFLCILYNRWERERGASSLSLSIQEHCSTLLHFNFILPSHHHPHNFNVQCRCLVALFSRSPSHLLLTYYPTSRSNNNFVWIVRLLHIKW